MRQSKVEKLREQIRASLVNSIQVGRDAKPQEWPREFQALNASGLVHSIGAILRHPLTEITEYEEDPELSTVGTFKLYENIPDIGPDGQEYRPENPPYAATLQTSYQPMGPEEGGGYQETIFLRLARPLPLAAGGHLPTGRIRVTADVLAPIATITRTDRHLWLPKSADLSKAIPTEWFVYQGIHDLMYF